MARIIDKGDVWAAVTMAAAIAVGVSGLVFCLKMAKSEVNTSHVDWVETARNQPLEPCFKNHIFARLHYAGMLERENMSDDELAKYVEAGQVIPKGPHEGVIVPEDCFAVSDGYYGFVGMHFGDEEEGTEFVSQALVFLPEDGTAPRMVCAGRVGPWMKDVADEFILEREHMKMTGEDRVVSSMCPVAVYEAAARKGYSLLQHPNGELEFSKTEEGHRLSITNEVWSGDEVGSISAGAETWRVTQVEIECGEEVADTVVLEGTSLPEAFATAQQLSTITPAREADGSLTTMGPGSPFVMVSTRPSQEWTFVTGSTTSGAPQPPKETKCLPIRR